jgi:hypothetical protein
MPVISGDHDSIEVVASACIEVILKIFFSPKEDTIN